MTALPFSLRLKWIRFKSWLRARRSSTPSP